MKHALEFDIESQPNDSSCGPTCLSAVYRYWEDPRGIAVGQLISEVGQSIGGGTLAVQLGCHALGRDYEAVITTYNLQVFDPIWFQETGGLADNSALAARLKQQRDVKSTRRDLDSVRLRVATDSYLRFLTLGGRVQMRPLDENLIVTTLTEGVPILCGLSATYLYQESRERGQSRDASGRTSVPDDVGGDPTGHFVVLHGFDRKTSNVLIADPIPNAKTGINKYEAPLSRVISAILLGIVTYDANLLTLKPRFGRQSL